MSRLRNGFTFTGVIARDGVTKRSFYIPIGQGFFASLRMTTFSFAERDTIRWDAVAHYRGRTA